MKKTLVWFLALCLFWSGVGAPHLISAFCLNGCEHPFTITNLIGDAYVPWHDDDFLHAHEYYFEHICEICGEWLYDDTEVELIGEEHVFDSKGKCTICGYQCKHNHTTVKYSGDSFEYYDETYHKRIRTKKQICDNCKAVVSSQTEWNREQHTYNKDGVCKACSYQKSGQAELHISVTADSAIAAVGSYISASASASGGDGKYSIAWTVSRNGSVFDSTTLGVGARYGCTANRAGSYVFTATVQDGTGAQATASSEAILVCGHDRVVESETGTPSYQNNGKQGHTKTVTVKRICADCGTVLEETSRSISEAHTFVNGVCACGEAEHTHTYEKVIISKSGYQYQTKELHQVTVTYMMRCTACGDTMAKEKETVTEAHAFTNKGNIDGAHVDQLGHQIYDQCKCGAISFTGEYGKLDDCCLCSGHLWSDPYEQNGRWMHECSRCHKTEATEAPSHVHKAKEFAALYPDTEAAISARIEIAKNHPAHSYESECTICGKKMTVSLTCDQCNCGHSKNHTHVTWPEDKTKIPGPHVHGETVPCLICGEQFPKGDWSATCILCNPNGFDYSKVSNIKNLPAKYSDIRKTDEFKEKYLYAPDGGNWIADDRYTADGWPPTLIYPQGYNFIYSAYYFTPEETEIIYKYMEARTNNVFWSNVTDWLVNIIGGTLEAKGKISKAGKAMIDGSKTFAEIGEYVDGSENEEISLTDEDLAELEVRMIGFIDADEAYILSDLIQLFSNVPYLGEIVAFYQVLSTIDYITTTSAIKDAVENGKGMVLENKYTYYDQTLGLRMEYLKKKWASHKGTIRNWNSYPYMDIDYDLYGKYTSK